MISDHIAHLLYRRGFSQVFVVFLDWFLMAMTLCLYCIGGVVGLHYLNLWFGAVGAMIACATWVAIMVGIIASLDSDVRRAYPEPRKQKDE